MALLFYCNQIILQINLERNDINTRSGSTDSWMFPSSPKLLIHPNETQFSSMKGWWLHLRAYDVGRDDRKAELSWNYPTDTLRVASLAFGSCRVVQLLRWWRCSRATKVTDLHLLRGEGQRICGHVLKLSQHLLVENWTVSFLITSDFSTIFLPCLPFLTLETLTWFRTGK